MAQRHIGRPALIGRRDHEVEPSRGDPVQALDAFGMGIAEDLGTMNHHRVSALGFGLGDRPEESGAWVLVAGLGPGTLLVGADALYG